MVSEKPTKGKEIECKKLKEALRKRDEFSSTEVDKFKLQDLKIDSFIKVDDQYFVQAGFAVLENEQLSRHLLLQRSHVLLRMCVALSRKTARTTRSICKTRRSYNSSIGSAAADG